MVCEPPVGFPGECPGLRVGVRDSFADGLLKQLDVPLERVGGPGVEELVQKLAAVPPDLLGLRADVGRHDGQEPGAVRVLDDEPHQHDPRGRHHVGGIL